MPSSFTPNRNLEKPADGEQDSTWGDTVNANMDKIDAALTGTLLNIQVFGAPGNFTYKPTAGVKSIVIRMVGGGGGGGGATGTGAGQFSTGGGGGGGNYLYKRILNPVQSNLVIGAGGASVVGRSGNNGGSSSFAGFYVAAGGGGGFIGGPSAGDFIVNPGSSQAISGTGDIECGGNPGLPGLQVNAQVLGGTGGSCAMFSGAGYGSAGQAGSQAIGPGCGGGGASVGPNQSAVGGGKGGDGFLLIEEYS